MADELLARQYVEFIAKGLGDVQAATAAYKQKLDDANKSADGLNKALGSGAYRTAAEQTQALNNRMAGLNEQARRVDLEVQFGKAGAALHLANEKLAAFNEGAKRVAGPATAGFVMLTGAILGFVRAGLAGTVQGEMLSFRMQMLSREIAGIFLPAISAVIDKLSQAVAWFRNLSGEKQNLIMKFALATVAALGVAMVFPKIVAGVQLAIIGIKALMAVIAAAGAEAGIASGGLLPLLGVLVTAGVALGTFLFATKSGSSGLQQLYATGQQLVQNVMPSLNRVMTDVTRLINTIAHVAVPAIVEAFKLWAHWIEIVVMLLEKLYMVWKITPAGQLFRALAAEEEPAGNKDHRVPTRSGTGFEDFMATYQRIANAAAGAGIDPQERAAKAAEKTEQNTNKILDFLEKSPTEWGIMFGRYVSEKLGL